MTATGIVGPAPTTGAATAVIRTPRIVATIRDGASGPFVSLQPSVQTISGHTYEATYVLSAKATLGLDLVVAEAEIHLARFPSWATYWSEVTLSLYAADPLSGPIFSGYLVEIDRTLWPREVTLLCRGRLVKAQLMQNTTIGGTDFVHAGTAAGSIDAPLALSGGMNDHDGIVYKALAACGLDDTHANLFLLGTGKTLGTVAAQNYLWAEGQDALSYIQSIDAISLGYRTFDDFQGSITRQRVDMTSLGTPVAVFTEGQDIFSGSSQENILTAKNRILVTGFDNGLGTGPATAEALGANSNIPTPPGHIVHQFSSPLIEKAQVADPGDGIACQEVADWLLSQWNRTQTQVSFVTPRDDRISPGDTITVTGPSSSPARLGVSGDFWVQNVSREVDNTNAFSQSLVCVAGSA